MSWHQTPIPIFIGIDGTLPPWYAQTLRKFDARALANALANAGIPLLAWCFQVKDPFGYTIYDSDIADRHPALRERDLLLELVTALHDQGIKAFGYYPLTWDTRAAEENPDWRVRNAAGEPIIGYWDYVCLNSPYREYCLSLIKEQATNYDIDGLFVDIPMFPFEEIGCYCTYCHHKFMGKHGIDIPKIANWNDPAWRLFVEWRYGVMDGFFRELRSSVKAIKPDLVVSLNFVAYWPRPWRWAQRMDTIPEYVDVVLGESHWASAPGPRDELASTWRDVGQIWRAGEMAKILRATGKPGWVAIGRHVYRWDYQVRPPAELRLAAASIVANGCSIGIIDSINPDGELDTYFYEKVLPEVGPRELIALRPWLTDAEPYPFAALHYSPRTRDMYDRDDEDGAYIREFRGAYKILLENHIPFDVVLDDDLTEAHLANYKVLVLPNAAAMSDQQIRGVERLVEKGGAVLATYETSLRDENGCSRGDFGLARIFGAHYEDVTSYSVSFVRVLPHPATEGMDTREVIKHPGRQILVRPVDGATVAGTIVYPLTEVTEKRYFMIPPDVPIGEDSGHPGLITNTYGDGRCAYFPSSAANVYGFYGYTGFRDLFMGALNWVLQDEVPVKTDAPRSVELTVYTQDARTIVHLVNYTVATLRAGIDGGTVAEDTVSVRDVRVELRLPLGAQVTRVYRAPSMDPLAYEHSEDGSWLSVVVPEVDLHEVVVVERSG